MLHITRTETTIITGSIWMKLSNTLSFSYIRAVGITMLAGVLAVTFSACGGGGGGSGTSSSSTSSSSTTSTSSTSSSGGAASISLSPSSINEQGISGEPAIMFVTGTVSEDLGVSTLYLGADADPEVFRSITFYQNEDSISAQIETHEWLWGGTYTGNISVYVCSDEMCNNHLANSPLTLPYTITQPKSNSRLEPVNYSASTVVDYDTQFVAINAESGTAGVQVEFRTEFSDSLGDLVFPDDMLEVFSVTEVSENGFTLNTPTLANGVYRYEYQLGFTQSSATRDLTVYYVVGREGGSQDQFVFFEDPIEVNALYGSPNNNHSTSYIIFGENRDILDYKEFTLSYIDGDNWVRNLHGMDNNLHIELATEDLPVGTYTARIDASTYHTQIHSSVDLVVHVGHGFDVFNQFDNHTFDEFFYDGMSYSAYVDNSLQAEGVWTATSPSSWIDIQTPTGQFLTQQQRDNFESTELVYAFNLQGLADLPNNTQGTGSIVLSANDERIPDTSIELTYDKRMPQLTQLSEVEVVADQPFSIDAQGLNLYSAEHNGVGLRVPGESNLFAYLDVVTLDDGSGNVSLILSHGGIATPGVYELVINHQANQEFMYDIAFVPRLTLTVVPAN